ncbi:hypothetical protein [Erythrobacter sp. NAP1]|uniref:hypothetical protein n=1 Tax=Erythrobacter sp. NAP1 TaxID=237727 RepID=UPI0002DABCE0|nr:hypothetical protein [Erythrobacter sp. NAP1]
MRNTFKPIMTLMTAACATSFTLAACTTEPDEVAEAPIEESTVVDATAPGVGVANPDGGAEQVTAVPGEDVYGEPDMTEPEAPSGAEPTNDIEPG